jgi:lipopolysaccharide biosynthesis glycosyltransferase
MIKIFIGFDPRETVAYHVFCNSLIRRSHQLLSITPLALNNLAGYTEVHSDGSNHFTYSRFLVPFLSNFHGWALFMDGDMVVNGDIGELWGMRDSSKAVMCVKHNYKTKQTKKYLGAVNQDYPRKNWSSVVMWNCSHPANSCLTPEYVSKSSGSHLHRFQFLDDELIGSLPIEWNWLPDEFGYNNKAKLLHWTLGTPCFDEYANAEMSGIWHQEHGLTNFHLD